MKQTMVITDIVPRAAVQQQSSPSRDIGDAGESFGSTLNEQMADPPGTDATTKPEKTSLQRGQDPSSATSEASPPEHPAGTRAGAAEVDPSTMQEPTPAAGERASEGVAVSPVAPLMPMSSMAPVQVPGAESVLVSVSASAQDRDGVTQSVQGLVTKSMPGSVASDALSAPGVAVADGESIATTSTLPGLAATVVAPAKEGGADSASLAALEAVQDHDSRPGDSPARASTPMVPGVAIGAPAQAVAPLAAQAVSGAGTRQGQITVAAAAASSVVTEPEIAVSGKAVTDLDLAALSEGRGRDASAGATTSLGASGFAQSLAAVASARQDLGLTAAIPRALPALDVAMASPQWGNGLGARIAFGIAAGFTSATLAVNPPELGPMNIQLSMIGEETSIQFASAHAAVREAIEAAMPRLREALAEEGIRLGDVAIDSGASHDDSQSETATTDGHDREPSQSQQADAPTLSDVVGVSTALVDTFA